MAWFHIMSSLETRVARYIATIEIATRAGKIYLEHGEFYTSTAAHMTGIFVREQYPFAAYSTYLMSKTSSQPLHVAKSIVPVATPCALYCP